MKFTTYIFSLLLLTSSFTFSAPTQSSSSTSGVFKMAWGVAWIYATTEYAKSPLGKVLGCGIGGYLIISGLEDMYAKPSSKKKSIDKEILLAQIKADVYNVFIHEMGIISKDFSAMAQGNTDLENDLEALYASFAIDDSAAQRKIDEFCIKWKLEKIIIFQQ